LFYDVHKENMFTINLGDGREAPSKARKKGAKRLEFLVTYTPTLVKGIITYTSILLKGIITYTSILLKGIINYTSRFLKGIITLY